MSAKESDLGSKNDCFSFAIRILNALKWNGNENHDLMEVAGQLIEPKLKELYRFSKIY